MTTTTKHNLLEKLSFEPLNIDGKDYLDWANTAKWHLKAKGLQYCIEPHFTVPENDSAIIRDASKTMIILTKHLVKALRQNYAHITNPAELWTQLGKCFNHNKEILLPITLQEWNNLRFYDHKSVSDYNTELYRIVTKLKICEQTSLTTERSLIEKTLSTFHPMNYTLSEQYRSNKYKNYSDLLTTLLLAEKQHEILTNNYNKRPLDKPAIPTQETNQQIHYTQRPSNNWRHKQPRSQQHQHRNYKQQRKNMPLQSKEQCRNCGLTGHETTNCRTNSFHVGLYQKHLKELSDKPQINFIGTKDSDHEVCDPLDFMDQTNEPTPDVNIIETDRINTMIPPTWTVHLVTMYSKINNTSPSFNTMNIPHIYKHFMAQNLSVSGLELYNYTYQMEPH
jgi:hypothetical protein